MRLLTYAPEHFPLAAGVAATAAGARSLGHRPFVDYYYATREWCRLYLALDADDEVVATIGIEQVPFEYEGRPVTLACGSNLATLRPGAGGLLFLHWVRSSELACVFGGSADTHQMIQRARWTYFHGVRTLRINRPLVARAGEPWWRAAAKRTAEALRPGVDLVRRARTAAGSIEVSEEPAVTADMLPASSPFTFRMRPTVDYVNWRYATGLSFVRYRCFRIAAGRMRGYVILNEKPGTIMVAQADADDPDVLAVGILAAVGRVAQDRGARCHVVLTCAHAGMLARLEALGFRADAAERALAIGSRRGAVDLAPDTSRWLINLDWIDNGLRAPFLDQAAAAAPPTTGAPARRGADGDSALPPRSSSR